MPDPNKVEQLLEEIGARQEEIEALQAELQAEVDTPGGAPPEAPRGPQFLRFNQPPYPAPTGHERQATIDPGKTAMRSAPVVPMTQSAPASEGQGAQVDVGTTGGPPPESAPVDMRFSVEEVEALMAERNKERKQLITEIMMNRDPEEMSAVRRKLMKVPLEDLRTLAGDPDEVNREQRAAVKEAERTQTPLSQGPEGTRVSRPKEK